MRSRRVLTLAAALVLAAPLWVGVAPTAAAPEAPPHPGPVVTLTGHSDDASVVVDRAGTATAVWATHWYRGVIMAAQRPAGQAWHHPVRIGVGAEPQAVVDAAGVVTVVFQTNRRGVTAGLSAVRRPPGGPWSPPVHLTTDRHAAGYDGADDEGQYGAHRTDVAVNAAGAVVVAWQWGSYDRSKPFRIQVARRPAGGPWQGATTLTRPAWAEDPAIAVDAAGRATLVYGDHGALVSRRFVPGAGWAAAVRVRGADPDVAMDLVMTPQGTSVLALQDFTSGGHFRAIVVERPAAGPWSRVRVLSPAHADVSDVTAAVDGRGTPVVAWSLADGSITVVRRPRGHWAAPVVISPPADGMWPQLAVDATGDLAVSWTDDTLGVRARVRDRRGHWTPTFTVWPPQYYDATLTAVYPDGDLLSVVQDDHVLRARRVQIP